MYHIEKMIDPFFSKLFAIAITVSGILFIISIALHKGFPILFSCILIFGLIVALFMHKQIFFKQPHNVYKYLIVSGAFALIVITIWSFTWNNSSKNNETQVTKPVVEDAPIKMPASSDSYIGKMYTDVSSEMSGLGFITVRTEEVKDLEISDKSKDKTVISVTSDSKSFSAGDEMPKNSVITIKYHGLADIAVPISSEEAKSMDYEAVAELFKKAGFTNVSTTTLQDKDPDEMTGEFETTIAVGTNTNVEKSLKVPVDTKIEVCKHTAYEKFPVNLHFENNYQVGIIIKLDSKDACAVEANATSDIEYRAKQGSLNITMIIDDSNTAEDKIEIDGPVNIGYVFYKDDVGYRYYESYEEHNRELKAGEIKLSFGIKDCEQNYNNVVEAFKQLGFKNVTASPVYDQNDSSLDNIVASVKIGDKSKFYRGQIYKESNSVTITYHMSKKSDPNYVPPKPTEAEKKQLEALKGGSLANAIKTINELDYTATYKTPHMDWTSMIDSSMDEAYREQCKVTYVSVSSNDRSVEVKFLTPEEISNQERQDNLEAKLSSSAAWNCAQKYGKTQYPYGFKLHYVLDRMNEEPADENTWFLRAGCTIENAFGNKRDAICEAYVTGTTANPIVIDFKCY